MRFGICFNVDYHRAIHGTPRDFYLRILRQCELLEATGFDSAWFSEHHSGPYSFGNPALMIAAAAMRTTTLRLGTGISILPLHHPLTMSEDYALLDQLTTGRLEYGVGRGYLMHEYPWLGIDADESRERYRESIEFITRAWSCEGRMDFSGKFYAVEGYTPFPPVWQQPMPPIYASALSPDSFEFAGARNFDLGVPLFVPRIFDGLSSKIGEYEQALADNGHDRRGREIMGITQMFCAADQAKAEAEGARYARNYFRFFSDLIVNASGPNPTSEAMSKADPGELNARNQTLFGTPAMLVDKIGRMREDWSVDYLQLEIAQGGCDPETVDEALQMFAEEVIPHFRANSAPELAPVQA
jgi:alkanesulfonate monooxygenase SsuD/methylene tetrahydromethanopterin reductase-like flavin-dependent oxidoreductase (luciferase family)